MTSTTVDDAAPPSERGLFEIAAARSVWRSWFFAMSLAWLVCGAWLLLVDDPPAFGVDDSVGHGVLTMVGGLVIGLLVVRRGPWWLSPVLAFVVTALLAILVEIIQPRVGSREGDVVDAVWSIGGSAIAALIIVAVMRSDTRVVITGALASTLVLTGAAASLALAADPFEARFPAVEASSRVPAPPEFTDPAEPDEVQLLPPLVGLASIGPPATGFVAPEDATDTNCLPSDGRYAAEPQAGPPVRDATPEPQSPALAVDLTVTPARVSGAASTSLTTVVALGPDGISVDSDGTTFDSDDAALATLGSASTLTQVIQHTQELTVELIAASGDLTQTGPARIVTISDGDGASDVNVHVAQQGDTLSVRLRATCDVLWLQVPDVFVDEELHHIVVTADTDSVTVAVDGSVRYAASTPVLRYDFWSPEFHLLIGNEASLQRPFRGTVRWAAFYDEAKTTEAITTRYNDVMGDQPGSWATGERLRSLPWQD